MTTDLAAAVIAAAIEWRRNVVVPTDPRAPLTYSRRLIAAVDAYTALPHFTEPHQ